MTAHYTLLTDGDTIPLNPRLAAEIGVNHALVLQQLHFLLTITRKSGRDYNRVNGEWWVYNSYEQWQSDHFMWLGRSTIVKIFSDLEERGLILAIQSVKNPMDRRKWYRINYDALSELNKCIVQKVNDGSVENDTMYTESTTESTKKTVSSSDETPLPTRKVLEASHVVNPAPPRVITLDALATNNPASVDTEMQANGYGDKAQSPQVRAALDKKARDEADKKARIEAVKAEEQRWQDDLPAMEQAVLDVFGIGGAPGGLYVGMLRGKGKRGEWKDYQITGGQVWAVDLRTWAAWWKTSNPGAHMVKEPDKVSGSIEAWLKLGKPKAGQKTGNGNQPTKPVTVTTADDKPPVDLFSPEMQARVALANFREESPL